jgi:hypothetical protein
MTEPLRKPDGDDGSGGAPPGMPRWVKVSALVVLVIAVVLVVTMLVVGGEHGPGLHSGAADPTRSVASLVS